MVDNSDEKAKASFNSNLLDEKWRASILERPNLSIRTAIFKLNDAGHLHKIPFLWVTAALQPLAEESAITKGLLELLMDVAVGCIEDERTKAQFCSSYVQNHLKIIASTVDEKDEEGGEQQEPIPIDSKPDASADWHWSCRVAKESFP